MTIEQFIIEYLNGALSNVSVSGSVPHPMPDKFVTVELTGSNRVDMVTTATIAVQSWAGTRAEAAELNETVKALMDAIISEPEISRSALDSDYNYTDLSTNHPRYQAVYEITFFIMEV